MDTNESLTTPSAAATAASTNHLFPVFLKLEQMRLLIVGGGPVALEKLHAVLSNSPSTNIKLVAETMLGDIHALAAKHANITLINRLFETADLEQVDIAIVAVNNKPLSAEIYKLAKQRQVLVNVSDTPEHCDFYLSSVVQKGNIKIAISTNGKSPTLAKRLKETLNDALPIALDDLAINLNKFRNTLHGPFEDKVQKLNKLTYNLHANEGRELANKWIGIAKWSLVIFISMLIGHFIFSYVPFKALANGTIDLYLQLDKNFGWIVLAGFLAQIVDGSLGMGYGITSATIMLSAGVNAASISASIHTAEMFASGASGYSHYKFGNVNKKLFKALVLPGVLGAIAGAILLVRFGESHAGYIRPIMATYTMVLGVKFIINGIRNRTPAKKFKRYKLLAGVGGFFDSFGGGGWGPIVTSTLVNSGRSHRYAIGTVSLTEFFVTLASAFSFFLLLGVTHWQVIVALILGGLVAAPIAAKLAGRLPKRTSFILLGVLIILWSLKILANLL
ncbi:MAG: ABC transporter permease [Bacteroidetes bacterium]|nr:MAG: ABC transporter permease [Bacteroidota bacterium]